MDGTSELQWLKEELEEKMEEWEEKYGGERVQPYMTMLEGIVKAINNDILTD